MWRIPVWLVGAAAGFVVVGVGSLWLNQSGLVWLSCVALVLGMGALVMGLFRSLTWVIDGPSKGENP